MTWAIRAAGTVATGANPAPGIPIGTVTNDLLLLVGTSSTLFSATPPTGYTQLARYATAAPFLAIWWKIATGSDPAPRVTNASAASAAVLVSYSGAGAVDIIGVIKTASATTIVTNTQTTTLNNDLVVSVYGGAVASSGTRAWTVPASTTSRVSSSRTTARTGMLIVDENKTPLGLTTARTGTTALSGALNAYVISFKTNLLASVAAMDGVDLADGLSETWMSAQVDATDGGDLVEVAGGSVLPTYAAIVATDAQDLADVASKVTAGAAVSSTNGADTLGATAQAWMTAQVVDTDGADLSAGTIEFVLPTSAAISATDGFDVADIAIRVTTGAAINRSDAPDALSAIAQVWIAAQVAATDRFDAVAIASRVTTGGAISGAEAPDALSATGQAWITAQAVATDGADTAALASKVTTGAAVSGKDAADTLGATAQAWMTTQVVATDGADIFAGATAVTTGAVISAADAADLTAALALCAMADITAKAGADVFAVTTSVTIGAAIYATDAADLAAALALSSMAGIVGTDGVDSAFVAAQNWITAQVVATDGADAANIGVSSEVVVTALAISAASAADHCFAYVQSLITDPAFAAQLAVRGFTVAHTTTAASALGSLIFTAAHPAHVAPIGTRNFTAVL